jgi:hypothetical protein
LNAYFFGRHDGDLPTHLLRADGAEHGIWAMAPLEGDEHNVFYAASTPESASLGDVTGTVEGAGSSVVDTVVQCVSEDCLRLVMEIIGIIAPCKIPGPPEWVIFIIIEGREQLRHLEHAQQRLGRDNVAAAYDGDGRFLVELASDDAELLDEVTRSFSELPHHHVVSTHRLRGRELQRT